jgi:Putative zinc-finger
MGLSLSNVKVTLHRARSALQEAYGLKLLLEEPTTGCAAMTSLLMEAHDGELGEERLRSLRRHLKICAACRERRDRLAVVSSLVALPLPSTPPSGLADRILKSLQKPSAEPQRRSKPSQTGGEAMSRGTRWIVFGGTAAVGTIAVALLGFAAFSFFRYRASGPALPQGGMSQVSIHQPTSGAELIHTDPVVVDATAIGPEPYSELQLWVNGTLVGVQAGPMDGQSPLSRSFDWIPQQPGTYSLVVEALQAGGNRVPSTPVIVSVQPHPRFPTDAVLVADNPEALPVLPPTPNASTAHARPWSGGIGDWLGSLTPGSAPAAPELSLAAQSCAAELAIHDLSDNEEGFAVYRSLPNATAWQKVASLASQSAAEWVTYVDPGVAGGIVYYVTAFNGEGESASATAVINVDPKGCPSESVQLQASSVELTDLRLPLGTSTPYCYRSHDGIHWDRWPATGFFVQGEEGQVLGGPAVQLWPYSLDGKALPPPTNLMLECWGRVDGSLQLLGDFSVQDLGSTEMGPLTQGDFSLQLATDTGVTLQPIELFPMGGQDFEFVQVDPGELEFGFTYHPEMVRPYLFATTDKDLCADHSLAGILLCVPYPGFDTGEGAVNPQPYLYWEFGDDCALGNGTPDPCKSLADWVELAERTGGSLGYRLYDSRMQPYWNLSEPRHHSFVIPPETCQGDRYFSIQMWYQPGIEMAVRRSEDLGLGPRGPSLQPVAPDELEAGLFTGDSAIRDLTLYGPPSNTVVVPCGEPLGDFTFVDVTFLTVELDNFDDDDDDPVQDVEVYGYLQVDAPHSPFGPSHFLNLGIWDEQDDDCVDDTVFYTPQEMENSLYAGCPTFFTFEPQNGADLFLCASTDYTTCSYSTTLGSPIPGSPVTTFTFFEPTNNTLRVLVSQGDGLSLEVVLEDWDDASANDLLCYATLDIHARSEAEWIATHDAPFTITGGGDLLKEPVPHCTITGVLNGGTQDDIHSITP